MMFRHAVEWTGLSLYWGVTARHFPHMPWVVRRKECLKEQICAVIPLLRWVDPFFVPLTTRVEGCFHRSHRAVELRNGLSVLVMPSCRGRRPDCGRSLAKTFNAGHGTMEKTWGYGGQ